MIVKQITKHFVKKLYTYPLKKNSLSEYRELTDYCLFRYSETIFKWKNLPCLNAHLLVMTSGGNGLIEEVEVLRNDCHEATKYINDTWCTVICV